MNRKKLVSLLLVLTIGSGITMIGCGKDKDIPANGKETTTTSSIFSKSYVEEKDGVKKFKYNEFLKDNKKYLVNTSSSGGESIYFMNFTDIKDNKTGDIIGGSLSYDKIANAVSQTYKQSGATSEVIVLFAINDYKNGFWTDVYTVDPNGVLFKLSFDEEGRFSGFNTVSGVDIFDGNYKELYEKVDSTKTTSLNYDENSDGAVQGISTNDGGYIMGSVVKRCQDIGVDPNRIYYQMINTIGYKMASGSHLRIFASKMNYDFFNEDALEYYGYYDSLEGGQHPTIMKIITKKDLSKGNFYMVNPSEYSTIVMDCR